ncbi:uncharacterized protein EDB91DRAFT_1344748 [Suillus paluster]|uniref:uncharacterized protein n=1 Tax=Suillus paluster TaxID=48578 RepID=UPI001B88315F|nr:uncharacterized protein EDB91DRAFT_1344748 [Suillus paluster]KAG1749085.1 hypothetical protein EDB91DRAFT_1344748 [Suillus paluster]
MPDSERTSNELTESDEEYRLLDTSGHPGTSVDHLPLPTPAMGSGSAEKSEGRRGDKLFKYGALASILVFVCITWFIVFTNDPTSLGWFSVHPVLQSLGIGCFTYGILTLQPTAHPKTKASGLRRHQRTMLAVGVPCIALGTLAIEIQKFNRGHKHFATWHGVYLLIFSSFSSLTILSQVFGLVSVVWLMGQVILGGGSVWFGGAAFGGGMKAKMIWKYHRLSGYILFPLLLITAHLGGAWSTWVTSHSYLVVRFVAYTVAPIAALVAIYARVRTSKMKFF